MKGLSFVWLLLILASCGDDDVVKINVNDPGIYAHYDIRAEEGHDLATCVVQFFSNHTMKNTLTLEEPSQIELDGQAMPADSSRFLGTYYEVQKPVSEFEGQHTFTFTSVNEKEYNEEFNFQPITLLTDLSTPVSKAGDLILKFEGLLPDDEVRLVMMDTAFKSNGINQLTAVHNGKLVIKNSWLHTLKNGPVILEISRESERAMKSGMKGKISTTYHLKRDLVVVD